MKTTRHNDASQNSKDPAGIKRTIGLDTGKTWESEDERQLARLSKKTDVLALAQIFKRTPTAIRYRLRLLREQGYDIKVIEWQGQQYTHREANKERV